MDDEAKRARREYERAYRRKNRDRLNEYRRQWNRANPDKVRAYRANYWTRKAAAGTGVKHVDG